MRLLKCYVSSFGKLKDATFDFSNNLTTIKEENGWGKSTLSVFIKSMFYGLNDKKRSLAENERLKYKPWNSLEKFGGYVEFSWGDKNFRIQRFFGNKEAEDTAEIMNLDTGKVVPTDTSSLGKRIFGIDEEGFLSTTFYSQKDFQLKSNTSITAKYNEVCEIQDSEAFDNALKKIEEKAKIYKYRGDKGIISDTKNRVLQINSEIERAEQALLTIDKLKNEIVEIEGQVNLIKQKSNDLTDLIAKAGKYQLNVEKSKRLTNLKLEREEVKARLNRADSILSNQTVTEFEINACRDCYNEYLIVNDRKVQTEEELAEIKIKKESTKTQNIKKFNLPFILALSLAVLSCCLFFVNNILAIVFVAVSLLASIFCLLLPTKAKEKSDPLIDQMIDEKQRKISEYVEISNKYSTSINAFVNKFNFLGEGDFYQKLQALSNALNDKKIATERLVTLDNEIDVLTNELLTFDNSNQNLDINSLNLKLKNLQLEFNQKTTLLQNKNASIKIYEQEANALIDLESEKSEKLELIDAYKQEYEILVATQKYLQKADENLKIRYRSPLAQSLNRYLKMIDSNISADIDIDYNVTILENGSKMDTEYYSKGYQNLFAICKRFALTDLLFTGEKPFIILDDPFYNLDDAKLQNALALVDKLSSEYQIIYLVCHESRVI